MAFKLEAIVGSTTVNLSNESPFALRGSTGMGRSAVRRVTAQGPAQHGDTDLGYRLAPRELELKIGFRATTDAILDGYRDTLMSIFKPLSATPVKLRVTRDDGGVRQLDCNVVGEVQIRLVKEHRPAHYHEATVRLRAAEPAWYGLAPGTVTVTGTASLSSNWWLAGGAIGTVSVLMQGGTPAQGAAWSYAGTIPTTTGWTIAFRSGKETLTGTPHYAFYVDNDPSDTDLSVGAWIAYNSGGSGNYTLGTIFMSAGTANYFVRHDPTGAFDELPTIWRELYYRGNGALLSAFGPSYPTGAAPISGTARRWRSDASNTASSRWTEAIPLYAAYSPGLTVSQMSALSLYMDGAVGGTVAQAVAVPYAGELPEYPVITLTGPITNPVITNTVTGDALDFGTITIGAGTAYVIDTRYGYKTVLAGTVDKRSELSDDSDVATWRLLPAPIATGGTNVVGVTGINASVATQIKIVYYNRFSSF